MLNFIPSDPSRYPVKAQVAMPPKPLRSLPPGALPKLAHSHPHATNKSSPRRESTDGLPLPTRGVDGTEDETAPAGE